MEVKIDKFDVERLRKRLERDGVKDTGKYTPEEVVRLSVRNAVNNGERYKFLAVLKGSGVVSFVKEVGSHMITMLISKLKTYAAQLTAGVIVKIVATAVSRYLFASQVPQMPSFTDWEARGG